MNTFTCTYAIHLHHDGAMPLLADVCIPEGATSAPLLVWMHSGGFRTGRRDHPSHARIAGEFGRHGYACAFIQYRLSRPGAILQPLTEARLGALIDEARAVGEAMTESFWRERPLAVVEDCCAFLRYAHFRREELGLSGRILLGGSSSGAISALNTLYLPRHLGIPRPDISTVLAFSGGFAYPSFLSETGARILAVHSPEDPKVPISSIRRLAQVAPDPMILIDSDMQSHGDLALSPQETLATAVDRCVRFDRIADLDDFEL